MKWNVPRFKYAVVDMAFNMKEKTIFKLINGDETVYEGIADEIPDKILDFTVKGLRKVNGKTEMLIAA